MLRPYNIIPRKLPTEPEFKDWKITIKQHNHRIFESTVTITKNPFLSERDEKGLHF